MSQGFPSSGEREGVIWDHGGPAPGESPLCRLDASTTVNPFPSPSLLARLGAALGGAVHYPDPLASEALRAIERRYGMDSGRVVAGGGATLLLYTLLGSGAFSRIIGFCPLFSEYRRAAEVSRRVLFPVLPARSLPWKGAVGSHLRGIFGEKGLPWGLDLEALPKILPGDLVVLVNPVNPTGQEILRPEILELFGKVSRGGGALLVDESFQDFLGNRSSVMDLAGEGPLFVLRSLTKVTGLPGIRAGFLAGPEPHLQHIREGLGPWALGTLEQALVTWAMEEGEADRFGYRPEAKDSLLSELLNAGWAVLPGEGPFVLASPNLEEKECRSRVLDLRKKGVRLRLASGFGPPGGDSLVRLGFEALSRPRELVEAFSRFS
ncbi:MAG: aminotransferase class I/II-fold pyridoxal phosphate-dependent enzyme [Leptospirillia bacterium]